MTVAALSAAFLPQKQLVPIQPVPPKPSVPPRLPQVPDRDSIHFSAALTRQPRPNAQKVQLDWQLPQAAEEAGLSPELTRHILEHLLQQHSSRLKDDQIMAMALGPDDLRKNTLTKLQKGKLTHTGGHEFADSENTLCAEQAAIHQYVSR